MHLAYHASKARDSFSERGQEEEPTERGQALQATRELSENVARRFCLAPLHNFIVLSVVFTTRWKKTETNRRGGPWRERGWRDQFIMCREELTLRARMNAGVGFAWGRVFMQRRRVSAQPSGMIDIWPLSANFSVSVASRKNNFIVKAEVEAYLFILRRVRRG